MKHEVDSFEIEHGRMGTRVIVNFADGARGSYGIDQIPSAVLQSCVQYALDNDMAGRTLEEAVIGRFVRATARTCTS